MNETLQHKKTSRIQEKWLLIGERKCIHFRSQNHESGRQASVQFEISSKLAFDVINSNLLHRFLFTSHHPSSSLVLCFRFCKHFHFTIRSPFSFLFIFFFYRFFQEDGCHAKCNAIPLFSSCVNNSNGNYSMEMFLFNCKWILINISSSCNILHSTVNSMLLMQWLKANPYTDSNKFKRTMNVNLMAISNVKCKLTSGQMKNNYYQHSKWFSLNTCFQCSVLHIFRTERKKERMRAPNDECGNSKCILNHFLFNWYNSILTFIVHPKLGSNFVTFESW